MKKGLMRRVLTGILFIEALMFCTISFSAPRKQVSTENSNKNKKQDWTLASISPVSDGGAISAGMIYLLQFTGEDMRGLAVKTNRHGKTQWHMTFGNGKNPVRLNAVVQAPDGSYLCAGESKVNTDGKCGFDFSKGEETAKLWKLDSKGKTVWEKDYGTSLSQRFRSLIRTSDNNYVVAGVAAHEGSGGDVRVMKFDIDGKIIWDKTLGGKKADWGFAVIQASDGGYALTGYTQSMGEQMNAYVAKLTPAGELEWENTYPGKGKSNAFSICQAPDGGYAVTGWTEQEKKKSVFVFKTDKTGKLEWEKFFEGTEFACGSSILPVEGEYLLSGRKSSGWLAKIDSSGNLLWEKVFTEDLPVTDIRGSQIPGGKTFLFIGGKGNFSGDMLMKIDSDGKIIRENDLRLKE